jgi:hypothetical protein
MIIKTTNLLFSFFFLKTIEKLTQSIHDASKMSLEFIKQCNEMDFPNGVESTQNVLLQTATQKNELEQELQQIKT